MNDLTVYRTADPDTIRIWRDACTAVDTYIDRIRDVLAAHGAGEYAVMTRTDGWRPCEFAGIRVPPGEHPPDGWRRGQDCEIPDRRVKAGQAIAAALAEVIHPGSPKNSLKGMPSMVYTGAGLAHPGAELLEGGTALYVRWGRGDPEATGGERRDPGGSVDHGIWERIPLSRYYLVKETEAAGA